MIGIGGIVLYKAITVTEKENIELDKAAKEKIAEEDSVKKVQPIC
jgi:hypothetical protein